MPIYWTAAARAGTALSQNAQQDLAAALAFAGWVIAAGIAWWNGSDEPKGTVDYDIRLDPAPSWQCDWHPFDNCYGIEWGCNNGMV